jgi:hypothetical protein
MPQLCTMPAKTPQSCSAEAASIRLCHSGRFFLRFLVMCGIRKKLDHSNLVPSNEGPTGLYSQGYRWIYRMKVPPKKTSGLASWPSFFSKLNACRSKVPSELGFSFTFTYFCKRYTLPLAELLTGDRGCNSRLSSRTGWYKAIRTGRRPQKN